MILRQRQFLFIFLVRKKVHEIKFSQPVLIDLISDIDKKLQKSKL